MFYAIVSGLGAVGKSGPMLAKARKGPGPLVKWYIYRLLEC